MGVTMLTRPNIRRDVLATALVVTLAGVYSHLSSTRSLAAEDSLLGGRVASSSGQPLAGIPIRAHRGNSNVSVNVYTNSRGEYSFPGWSDLSPGSYSIAIDLPDFVPVKREAVTLSAGRTARLDFTLQSRQPSITDATASEIVAALPGTR